MNNNNFEMQNFEKLFNEVLSNRQAMDMNGIQLYNAGVNIVLNSNNTVLREEILSKLMFLFPDEKKLYHLMGIIFEEIAPFKSIMWFKLCHQKDPEFIENIVSMSIYYYKNRLLEHFMELNKNNLFNKIIDSDTPPLVFLNIYVNMYIQINMFNGVVKCLTKLIQQTCKKKSVTQQDQLAKWWAYHHLGYSYIVTSDNIKAIEYTSKAVDLADKFNINLDQKLLSFQNMVAFYDFIYNKSDDNFQRYLKINEYLPNVDMFSFKGWMNGDKKRKIRIGYVSSDFTHHPVSNFIAPILNHYNRELFEITLFPNMDSLSPEYVTFLKRTNVESFTILKLSDVIAAQLIHSKKIDILIDLNGHTTGNRLGIFAMNPSPIQVTYLGYPNTTGLKSIKYRITDAVADNVDSIQQYSEKLVRMPKCFLNFQSIHQLKPTVPKKTDPRNIILGALNKEKKNSVHVLSSWKRIMKECPNTTIMIKMETFDNVEERTEFYKRHLDIDASRMIIFTKLMNHDYDVLFTRIDIVIDTYPYTGTTTTCETLYNSVPIVTMKHRDYHCHNVSASILVNSDLPELVTSTPDEYVDKVKELVNNPHLIDEYKRTIHDKFTKGMDPVEFMRDYDKVLVDMYNVKI